MWRPFAGSTSWRAVSVALPVSAFCFLALGPSSPCGEPASDIAQFSSPRGICAVLGAIGEDRREQLIRYAGATEWTFFFQASNPEEIDAARRFAIDRGILGSRVFVEPAPLCSIHLANNLADLLFASGDSQTPEAEILRVLRPGGVAHVGDRQVVKPMPEGTDAWSHPYHTPDNNTLSTDRLARAPYLTQFMAEPMFSPMPEVTVAAGGRVFKACGHIAHKKNQNQQLNTLFGINGYNGTILWTRPLAEGFMIHRNTMIGKYVSLEYALPGGEELVYDASYEGSRHSELALLGPLPAGAPRTVKVASRWQSQRRGETARKTIWKHEPGPRYNSFAIGQKNLLAAGHAGEDDQTGSSLAAIELTNGKVLWKQELSGAVVKAGTAVDREGRILVALRDGTVLCYAGK